MDILLHPLTVNIHTFFKNCVHKDIYLPYNCSVVLFLTLILHIA